MLTLELKDRGIRVNALSPGPTATAGFEQFAARHEAGWLDEITAAIVAGPAFAYATVKNLRTVSITYGVAAMFMGACSIPATTWRFRPANPLAGIGWSAPCDRPSTFLPT